jgi:hypothetical protein
MQQHAVFLSYTAVFLSNKNSVYIYTRVFLHTLQPAGDITHFTIHHKLFHASCLYYVSCITVVNPGYATDVIHFLSKVLLPSTDSKLLNYIIYQSRQSLLYTAKRSPAVIGRELVPSNV